MRVGIFSLIAWDFIHQRPHKFAEELAALGHTVYYVEPPDLAGDRLSKLRRALQMRPPVRVVAPGIHALRPLVVPPYRAHAGLLPYNRFLQPLATRLLRQLRLDFAIVLATEYGPVVRALGIPFAYDHVDDTQFMEHILTEQFIHDMELLKASSAFNIYIQEAEAERDPKGFFIPNGVDMDQFHPLPVEKLFDAVVLSNITKWFDMDSVMRSRHRILLIGPMDIDRGNNRARFLRAKRPNLLWIPQIDKEVANLWLSRASVGLVPFKADHPVVRYAMPIKILEYFLANLPVVTYRNEGIARMYRDMVTFYSADGADPPLDEAIEIARTKTGFGYREFAARYQWEDIVGQLEERIAREFGRASSGRTSARSLAVRSSSRLVRKTPPLIPAEAVTGAAQSTSYSPGRKLRIAYFGATDWEFVRQRPQQLAGELSRYHDVAYVRPVPLSRVMRGRPMRALPPRVERLNDTLTVLRPRALSPGRVGAVARVNDALAARDVRRQLAGDPLDVLWLSHPSHRPFVGKLDERIVVYDLMDNHVSFAGPDRSELVDSLEVELLRVADVVIVSSEGLKARAAQHASGLIALVPNGVDWEHFAQAAVELLPRPPDLPPRGRFAVGFYGTLGPWVDTRLLRVVAERHPEWETVLIGPVLGADLGALDGLPNVHLLGAKPYEALPHYLQHIPVWTVPFRKSPLTADVDPVKIYEYLAAGKPVVASDLPELAKFGELIKTAGDTPGFMSGLEAVYEEVCAEVPSAAIVERVNAVRPHSWHERAALVSQLLEQALARRATRCR